MTLLDAIDLKFKDYAKVFTPSAPMLRPDFFFGRQQQQTDLQRAIDRQGNHPVIIGARGVGKTSLVKQTLAGLEVSCVYITCNSKMSFDRLAKSVLRQCGTEIDITETSHEVGNTFGGKMLPFGMGAEGGHTEKKTEKRQSVLAQPFDAWNLFEELRYMDRKIVIVLDEYDTVPATATDFHQSVAELMKTLADNSDVCDSRLVIVGVAQSAKHLLEEHESIDRSAREIYLRPLRRVDVDDFLTEAERTLRFSFLPIVKEAIIENSSGYPYYVHLVGLECMEAMHSRNPQDRTVVEEDFEQAVQKAVEQAFRSVLRRYQDAVSRLDGDREASFLIKHYLSLSYPRKGTRDFLSSRVVTKQILKASMLKNGILENDEFEAAFATLQYDVKLIYTTKSKEEVRFFDPLMLPFLKTKIFPKLDKQQNDSSAHQLALFDTNYQPGLF